MDWPWQSTELATMVTKSQSARFPYMEYMKNMVYEHKVDTLDQLLQWIFDAIRQVTNDAVLHKVMFSMVEQVRTCIQADGNHFEYILN
jgi:hypothetical protein